MSSKKPNIKKEKEENAERVLTPAPVPFKFKYCRLCAWELTTGVLIFGDEGKRLNIPEKIRKTLGILVLEEDNLPKRICTDCCSSLEDYSIYKDTVMDAQEKLTPIANVLPNPLFQPFRPQQDDQSYYNHNQLRNEERQFSSSSSSQLLTNPVSNIKRERFDPSTSHRDKSNQIPTCKICGKKFKTRADFDRHSSTHRISTPTPSTSSKSWPPIPQVKIGNSRSRSPSPSSPPPASPAMSNSCEPVEMTMTVDLEEEPVQKDSKAGITQVVSKGKSRTNIWSQVVRSNQAEDASNPNSLQCKYCLKVLLSRTGLYSHMLTHKGRKFNCKQCGKSFTQKVTLREHMAGDHPKKPVQPKSVFPCPQCSSCYTRKSSLNEHLKTHTEHRPFECTICSKFFKSEKDLGKHVKMHTAEDTYPCSMCDKKFWRKSKLEEHENTHADRRPYGCNFCVKTFNNVSNYTKHVKRKHKERIEEDGKVPPHVKVVFGDEKQGSPVKGHPPVGQPSTLGVDGNRYDVVPGSVEGYSGQATPLPLSLTSSPSWINLTGNKQSQSHQISQQQQQQQQIHPQQQQPLAMNMSGNSNHSHQHQQMQQQQSHNPQPQQQQIHQHQLQHPVHHQSTLQQQQPHNQPQGHHHLQLHVSNNHSHHHQQHSYPNPNTQIQQISQGQTSSSHHQPQQSNGLSQHLTHSVGQNNTNHHQPHVSQGHQLVHSHLLQTQSAQSQHNPYSNHHHLQSQPQLQVIPVQAGSSQNHSHYLHNPHAQSMNSTTMDLVDCAIQSFNQDQQSQGQQQGPQQNHPMELIYNKLEINSTFQEMPMELTKVFQTGPLELCVRNDFSQLVDLTSAGKEQSFSERMNIMDFRQQPIDLIARNEACGGSSGLGGQSDNNNLVDLSLRPSFQDQTESSFFRELIDLSSRSDYHGQLNLSSKSSSLSHNTQSQGSGGSVNQKGNNSNSMQQNVYAESMFGL